MSKATKRKHVVKEVLSDYVKPTEHQLIVRVLGSPGNNLHEVQTSEGEKFLASMPTKFRKNIWIKRGDYLIVDPIAEGDKVKAEIAFILYKDHQRLLQKEGLWPSGFGENTESITPSKESNQKAETNAPATKQTDESDTDSEDDSNLFVNTNRMHYEDSEEEEEESESDEEEK